MDNPIKDKYRNKFWYNELGQIHREDGPAIIYSTGDKEYCINGKLHRVNGPAVERANGEKEYWINNIQYKSLEEGLMDQALK